MPPKKRSPLACCGIGCVGMFGLALIVFAVWFGLTGRYMPAIPPPSPVPRPNALDDYIAAGQMLKANGTASGIYGPPQQSSTSGPPLLVYEKPVVAKNQAALARLRQAFDKPCRIPRVQNMAESFPYLADVRDLARLLSAEADVKAARGDFAGAFSSGIDGIHMGQDFMHGGLLIHALVGIACEAIVQQPMVRAVDKLPAQDCDRLIERLQREILTRVPNPDILREEHYSTLGMLARMPSSDFAPATGAMGEEDESAEGARAKQAFGALTWHFVRDKTLHELENYFQASEREAAKPPSERHEVPEPRGFAVLFAPVFTQASNKLDEIDLRNRLLLCAAAIRRYHLKHGALPASLRDIGLDPHMLADPYSGKELMYRPIGADYLLYSVGPDGKDDGGVPADEGQGPSAPGDFGLRRFDARPSSRNAYRLVPHMNPPKLPPGAPVPPP